MNYTSAVTSAIFIILLAALPGCNSKKDKADQASPPLPLAAPATQPKAGGATRSPKSVVTAPPQDETDVAILKEKVLVQLKANDFAGIYKDASDGFRKVGLEKQFVELWQKQLQQTGPFKEAKEVSKALRPEDNALATIFKVKYEKANKAVRLIFGRSKSGKMELIGINQRDPM